MAHAREDVYATLLLNDAYLPGALVLAHSLRDAGATKKLAVLVTTDTVSIDAMVAIQATFDFIIPVERIASSSAANLALMNRPDLHSTFTKINLWKQLQFRRIVYLDADMVAFRAPDELFNLPDAFSAAPDIGWPDIFNTGLMVLNPNMGDYYALLGMAQRGMSFDGADQGLLNMYFRNTFNRLSFTYNVTPSAHYQYLPAYRYFQSSISMAHFIGTDKPWTMGRHANTDGSPYDELLGRWWAVYDKHYRQIPGDVYSRKVPPIVQYYTKGEFNQAAALQTMQPQSIDSEMIHPKPIHPSHETLSEMARVIHTDIPPTDTMAQGKEPAPTALPAAMPVEDFGIAWDASKASPPLDSRPEAGNFPDTRYEMSSDPNLFRAPDRYPDPPSDMYYETPKTPSYQKPAKIFPWESEQPTQPSRVFPEDDIAVRQAPSTFGFQAGPPRLQHHRKTSSLTPSSTRDTEADPWQSYANAWDSVPGIGRYVGNLQKNRKAPVQVLGRSESDEQTISAGIRPNSIKLTDFPTEFERPSLPVTPAPIRRSMMWGDERSEQGQLPAAEGVPSQEDWDPAAQLEQLARQQSAMLAGRLAEGDGPAIPLRPQPFGSEGVTSPTYVARSPPAEQAKIEEPAFHGPGAAWEKDEEVPSNQTPAGATEEEADALEN